MSDIDVNQQLLDALKKRWPQHGPDLNWSDFDTSKVQLKLLSLDYKDLAKSMVTTPSLLSEADVNNPEKSTITHTITYSQSFTDSYEWNVAAGLKLTAGAKGKVGLPIVAEGEVSASVEITFTGGYKATHSETVTIAGSDAVNIPAETNLRIKELLSVGKATDIPFTAKLRAYGQVGAKVASAWKDGQPTAFSWTWSDLDTGGWTNVGFHKLEKLPLDPADRVFTATGTFSTKLGLYVHLATGPLQP